MKNKKKKSVRHYNDLNRLVNHLFNQTKDICMKEMLPPKEEFVRDYPLSIIGICSIKKFWEVCFELGIVQHPFYEDETKYNPFERELHELCDLFRYADEEDYKRSKLTMDEFRQRVEELFDKYQISY